MTEFMLGRSTSMNSFGKISGAFLLALLALGLVAGEALACSCAGPREGKERAFYRNSIKQADGAVIATLRRVRENPSTEAGEGRPPFAEGIYVFQIHRAFKKKRRLAPGTKVRVRASLNGGSCGYDLDRGERAGLLLWRSKKYWSGGLCGTAKPKDLRKGARALRDRASSKDRRAKVCSPATKVRSRSARP